MPSSHDWESITVKEILRHLKLVQDGIVPVHRNNRVQYLRFDLKRIREVEDFIVGTAIHLMERKSGDA